MQCQTREKDSETNLQTRYVPCHVKSCHVMSCHTMLASEGSLCLSIVSHAENIDMLPQPPNARLMSMRLCLSFIVLNPITLNSTVEPRDLSQHYRTTTNCLWLYNMILSCGVWVVDAGGGSIICASANENHKHSTNLDLRIKVSRGLWLLAIHRCSDAEHAH